MVLGVGTPLDFGVKCMSGFLVDLGVVGAAKTLGRGGVAGVLMTRVRTRCGDSVEGSEFSGSVVAGL